MAVKPVLVDLDFQTTARGVNVPDPVIAGDMANKNYVDNLVEGLAWKDDARVNSSGNVNIAAAPAAVDGVTLTVGDRVLLSGQTAPSENGIYLFAGVGNAMTRASDANASAELNSSVITVGEGTSAGSTFRQTVINPAIGVDPVTFSAFGAAAPAASTVTAGIIRVGTQGEVDAGVLNNVAVTPATLAANPGNVKRFAATFGTAVDTLYTLTHNLGTLDVIIMVYDAVTNETVIVASDRTDVNNVVITTNVAPGLNSLRAVILA